MAAMLWTRFGRLTLLLIVAFSAVMWIGVANSCSAALIDLTPTNGVNSSTSVSLGDLVSGQVMGVTVGDKVFTGFNYSPIGDMPPATAVQVLGFKDPDGNWGVSFHGSFVDLPGDGASDALLRFMVQVNPDQTRLGRKISDAHLFLGGVGAGPQSVFTVDESFLQYNNSLSTFYSTINAPPITQKLNDSTVFTTPTPVLNVTKDIFALAGPDSTQPARATVIDQSFSQVVPEPATLAMLGLAGLGLAGFVRRRT
jgi:PEP-CTERM motif